MYRSWKKASSFSHRWWIRGLYLVPVLSGRSVCVSFPDEPQEQQRATIHTSVLYKCSCTTNDHVLIQGPLHGHTHTEEVSAVVSQSRALIVLFLLVSVPARRPLLCVWVPPTRPSGALAAQSLASSSVSVKLSPTRRPQRVGTLVHRTNCSEWSELSLNGGGGGGGGPTQMYSTEIHSQKVLRRRMGH